MSKEKKPYVSHCGFCQEGLLRFRQCPACDAVCAVCDECELTWSDIVEVSGNPRAKAAGSFPTCPACGETRKRWPILDARQLRKFGLADYIGGESV